MYLDEYWTRIKCGWAVNQVSRKLTLGLWVPSGQLLFCRKFYLYSLISVRDFHKLSKFNQIYFSLHRDICNIIEPTWYVPVCVDSMFKFTEHDLGWMNIWMWNMNEIRSCINQAHIHAQIHPYVQTDRERSHHRPYSYNQVGRKYVNPSNFRDLFLLYSICMKRKITIRNEGWNTIWKL
jgi:hypothetical protein